MAFKPSPLYRNKIKSISVSMFKKRTEAYDYLEKEVFSNIEFINNVKETAATNNVSYVIAYAVITNYLTDVLYEIDKSIAKQKVKKKIILYSYFSLKVGFMESFRNKKMFLEQIIKKL